MTTGDLASVQFVSPVRSRLSEHLTEVQCSNQTWVEYGDVKKD